MLNRFEGIGRLGKPPELRYTPSGSPVCNFSVATESSYKSGDEWKKQTFWADIVMFGKRAESASKHLVKGSLVYVEGRLQTRSWESNGQKHYKTEVIVNDIKFLDSKGQGGGQDQAVPEEESSVDPF